MECVLPVTSADELTSKFPCRAIAEDGESHVEMYNSELERLSKSSQNTWFKAPWLFAEYVPLSSEYSRSSDGEIHRCYLWASQRSWLVAL